MTGGNSDSWNHPAGVSENRGRNATACFTVCLYLYWKAMSRVLANMLVLWAFAISPVLCISGVLPDLCGESGCCDACTDCAPHTPLCVEDSCHQIIIPLLRGSEDCELAVLSDTGPLPYEALQGPDATTPPIQVLSVAPCPERAPPNPPDPSLNAPLLI